MKILYFTTNFSAENQAFAKQHNLVMRNLNAYHDSDFIEQCDKVCGDVPVRYQHIPLFELSTSENPKDKGKTKGSKNDPNHTNG